MDRRPPWILSLNVCLILIHLFMTIGSSTHDDSNPGFISIDCGASEDYINENTGIRYQTDKDFVETGVNRRISTDIKFENPYFGEQLDTVRSFPEGDRNCYNLKPKQGKNNKYLIRAFFAYGNYDNNNEPVKFELYLGANYWDTVLQPNSTFYGYYDIIHTSLTDTIYVCLVNINQGTPFISILELRLLDSSTYSASLPLSLLSRVDLGNYAELEFVNSRYKDDVYDRVWHLSNTTSRSWYPLNASADFDTAASPYKLPSEVLRTAVQPFNVSYNLFMYYYSLVSDEYFVYLHFAEIQRLPQGRKRVINVTFHDTNSSYEIVTLEYLKPVSLTSKNPTRGYARFTISAAAESKAPPILNAYEIYKLVPQPNAPTNAIDVDAIVEIKRTYGISRINWQGDPCAPIPPYAWDGLTCSSDNNPRIISLNLNSSKLSGQIAPSFSNLKSLEYLDLSNNELTGPLPDFLAEMPNLKFLNLSVNKLTGSIPKALKERADLQLSLADNPGLCLEDSCKEHKFIIPLAISIAVFFTTIVVSLVIWVLVKRRRQVLSSDPQTKGSLRPKNRAFSYYEVLSITNNLRNIIGEGGFGRVYYGTLEDGTQVAVKLLSPSSKQGYKEFQSGAKLLMIVHHRNLVSLVGYCNEHNVMALIYEYMDNGDLSHQLSVLRWSERLRVAVDAAAGLDYLHNGCKPAIIHRDLKPSNILLNEDMQAKIADFGLSRAFANEKDTHLSTQPAGTPGYIDSEFQKSGSLSKKSDIYSFGMILLELITGLPPIRRSPDQNIIFMLDWIRPKIDSGDIQSIVDSRLQEFSTMSAWKAVEIAISCVVPAATERPDISHILQELKECLALEMDHVRKKRFRTESNNSLNFTVQLESEFIPSAR